MQDMVYNRRSIQTPKDLYVLLSHGHSGSFMRSPCLNMRYKMSLGELPYTDSSSLEPASGPKQMSVNLTPGSGRAMRDAAARAMQGWHSRLHGNGDVGDPIIKDKTSSTTVKREKQGIGLLKRKKPAFFCQSCSHENVKTTVVIFVLLSSLSYQKDCFEVYALVPRLLREEA